MLCIVAALENAENYFGQPGQLSLFYGFFDPFKPKAKAATAAAAAARQQFDWKCALSCISFCGFVEHTESTRHTQTNAGHTIPMPIPIPNSNLCTVQVWAWPFACCIPDDHADDDDCGVFFVGFGVAAAASIVVAANNNNFPAVAPQTTRDR